MAKRKNNKNNRVVSAAAHNISARAAHNNVAVAAMSSVSKVVVIASVHARNLRRRSRTVTAVAISRPKPKIRSSRMIRSSRIRKIPRRSRMKIATRRSDHRAIGAVVAVVADGAVQETDRHRTVQHSPQHPGRSRSCSNRNLTPNKPQRKPDRRVHGQMLKEQPMPPQRRLTYSRRQKRQQNRTPGLR